MGFNAAMIGITFANYPLLGIRGWVGDIVLLSVLAFPIALLISKKLKTSKQKKNTPNLNLSILFQKYLEQLRILKCLNVFAVFFPYSLRLGSFYTISQSFKDSSGISYWSRVVLFFVESWLSLLLQDLWQVGFQKHHVGFILWFCHYWLYTIHNTWLLIIPCIIFELYLKRLAFPTLQAMM